MSLIDSIVSPTLLLDESIARANLRRMVQRAKQFNVELRPHMKTHQSHAIGRWMYDAGVRSITVSSVAMAHYFAAAGWNDITIAFPYNPRQADAINKLTRKCSLTLLMSDAAAWPFMKRHITEPIRIFIEVDTGSNRSGFAADQIGAIQEVAQDVTESPHIRLRGLYSHPGHTYTARSEDEIIGIHTQAVKKLRMVKQSLASVSDDLHCCIGDTPGATKGIDFTSMDSISPGNFIFYDAMQTQIGSCSLQDIAVTVAAPVVSVSPKEQKMVVHAGAIHLSKEQLQTHDGAYFGLAIPLNDNLSWRADTAAAKVTHLSQEHGTIKGAAHFINQFSPGDLIGILPVHSCLTAHLMGEYTLTGSGKTLDHMHAANV